MRAASSLLGAFDCSGSGFRVFLSKPYASASVRRAVGYEEADFQCLQDLQLFGKCGSFQALALGLDWHRILKYSASWDIGHSKTDLRGLQNRPAEKLLGQGPPLSLLLFMHPNRSPRVGESMLTQTKILHPKCSRVMCKTMLYCTP